MTAPTTAPPAPPPGSGPALPAVTAQAERGMDLVVSCNNEWPGTKPGLNYVHYPARARPRPAAVLASR